MGKEASSYSKSCMLTINCYSRAKVELLKTVLRYEAGMIGGSPGQALWRLVMQYAAKSDLPDEVRTSLERTAAGRERESALKASSEVILDAIA